MTRAGPDEGRLQPAPPGGLAARRNLFLGIGGLNNGFPALTRSVGSGVFSSSQQWGLIRRGGSVLAPHYVLQNAFSGACVGLTSSQTVAMVPCAHGVDFQFRPVAGAPRDPRLMPVETPRLYRLVSSGSLGEACLAPHNLIERGGLGYFFPCRAPVDQLWVYRRSVPEVSLRMVGDTTEY